MVRITDFSRIRWPPPPLAAPLLVCGPPPRDCLIGCHASICLLWSLSSWDMGDTPCRLHCILSMPDYLSSVPSIPWLAQFWKTVVQPPPSGHLFIVGGIVSWMLMQGIHSISAMLSPNLLLDSTGMFDQHHFSIYWYDGQIAHDR